MKIPAIRRYVLIARNRRNKIAFLNSFSDNIPGKSYHNGSRVIISPDNKIVMSTGDAADPKQAQDVKSLSGKILRLNLDGSVPSDNPIADSYVWTWGHRK